MALAVNDSIAKGDSFNISRELRRGLPIDFWMEGRTPLMTAILHEQISIVDTLLDRGANLEKCCHVGGAIQVSEFTFCSCCKC